MDNLPERDADGTLPAYAWPGGYPLYYIGTDARGHWSEYCPRCASQADAEPPITACDVNWEDAELYCDGCGTRIESAYAEDAGETS